MREDRVAALVQGCGSFESVAWSSGISRPFSIPGEHPGPYIVNVA